MSLFQFYQPDTVTRMKAFLSAKTTTGAVFDFRIYAADSLSTGASPRARSASYVVTQQDSIDMHGKKGKWISLPFNGQPVAIPQGQYYATVYGYHQNKHKEFYIACDNQTPSGTERLIWYCRISGPQS